MEIKMSKKGNLMIEINENTSLDDIASLGYYITPIFDHGYLDTPSYEPVYEVDLVLNKVRYYLTEKMYFTNIAGNVPKLFTSYKEAIYWIKFNMQNPVKIKKTVFDSKTEEILS
jgi:hypothetical protein